MENTEECQQLKKIFLESISNNKIKESQYNDFQNKYLKCQQLLNHQQKPEHQDWNKLVCFLFTSS